MLAFFFFSWILWNSTYKEVRICILIKLALFFWLLCEFYLWIGAGWILFEVRRNSTVGPDVIFCSVIVISFLLIFMYGGAFIPSWEIWTVSRRHGCKMPAVLWCWWLGPVAGTTLSNDNACRGENNFLKNMHPKGWLHWAQMRSEPGPHILEVSLCQHLQVNKTSQKQLLSYPKKEMQLCVWMCHTQVDVLCLSLPFTS